jgi:hypothetical protein
MTVLEMMSVESRNNLLMWAFGEAIRTQDKGAIELWFNEADAAKERKS